MKSFNIEVRLETPLLQGGPNGDVLTDDDHRLCGEAMRGRFLRRWARVLIESVSSLDALKKPNALKKIEDELLGSASDETNKSGGKTYSVRDISLNPLGRGGDSYSLIPHQMENPKRKGYRPKQCRCLRVDFQPAAYSSEFENAIKSVLWTALTLGTLGCRGNRGFGSMSITDFPKIKGLKTISEINKKDELSAALQEGIDCSLTYMREWLKGKGIPVRSDGDTTFPLKVYVGRQFDIETVGQWQGREAVEEIMSAIESLRPQKYEDDYIWKRVVFELSMGTIGDNDWKINRMGSPLLVKFFLLGNQWVPVCTCRDVEVSDMEIDSWIEIYKEKKKDDNYLTAEIKETVKGNASFSRDTFLDYIGAKQIYPQDIKR